MTPCHSHIQFLFLLYLETDGMCALCRASPEEDLRDERRGHVGVRCERDSVVFGEHSRITEPSLVVVMVILSDCDWST